MRKRIIGLLCIIMTICCVGCSQAQKRQPDIISSINEKYGLTLSENDVAMLDEEDGGVACYFGVKEDIFDPTECFAAVYDASNKTFIDNYSACIVEDEIIDRVKKVTPAECVVYVHTMSYPLSTEKYTTFDELLDGTNAIVSFSVYAKYENNITKEQLLEAYKNEFGHTGDVYLEIAFEDDYKLLQEKKYDDYYTSTRDTVIYKGDLTW